MIQRYEALTESGNTYVIECHSLFLFHKKWFIFKNKKRFFLWGSRFGSHRNHERFVNVYEIKHVDDLVGGELVFLDTRDISESIVWSPIMYSSTRVKSVERIK